MDLRKSIFALPILGWAIGAASLFFILDSGLKWPLLLSEVNQWQWALSAANGEWVSGLLSSGTQNQVFLLLSALSFLLIAVATGYREVKNVSNSPKALFGSIDLLFLASCWGMWRELAIHPLAALSTIILLALIFFSRSPLWLYFLIAVAIAVCTGTWAEGIALGTLLVVNGLCQQPKAPSNKLAWAMLASAAFTVLIMAFLYFDSIILNLSVGLNYGLAALVLLALLIALQSEASQRIKAAGWLLVFSIGILGQKLGIGGGFAIWVGLAGLAAWGARQAWEMAQVRSLAGLLVTSAVLLNALSVWSFRTEALLITPPELIDSAKRTYLLSSIPTNSRCIFAPDSTGAQFALYLSHPNGLSRPSVASLLSTDQNGNLWIANAIRSGYNYLVVRTPALEGYEGLQPFLKRKLVQVGLFQMWELNQTEDGIPARGLAQIGN